MSAVQKSQSSSSSSSSSSSAASSGAQENGARPEKAKGAVGAAGAANFGGGLAIASAGTPAMAPPTPKPAKKPAKKKTSVANSKAQSGAPGSDPGSGAGPGGPGATGGGAGAEVGAASEAGKASKAVTSKKPSKLLENHKSMAAEVSAAKKVDEQKAHDAIPEFHAVMPGDAASQADNAHGSATADKKVTDKPIGPEAKAKKSKKDPGKKSARQKVDGGTKSKLKQQEAALEALKAMFSSIVGGINTDSQVGTSPGPAPEIEFSGSSNPQRADASNTDANKKMNAGHDKFAQAIDDGKQPSDVKRLEMDDLVAAIQSPELKLGEESVQAGERYYEQLVAQHLPEEINKADDLMHGDVQKQMDTANKQMDETLEAQEAQRTKAVAEAEKDIEGKNADAKKDQEKIVGDTKKKIAREQKATRKEQDKEISKAKRSGDKERRKVEKDISSREVKDEKKVKSEYSKAEKKADGEKQKAEKKASAKKKEAKKKESEKSWWDRVKSAVSDFVDSVCSAIGDIFDALGKLVSGVLNAVKDLACALIDEAIKWAKKALDGLGGLLKGLVNGLIGDIFPGLAKKLNKAIDDGIDLAKKGVDTVGENLKKGVVAAVDGVNATVQKGLQVAKVGMQTAVRVAGCVATGDFEGAFLATFYGALEIAGVSRGDADKMLGNAQDTLKSIVDDPGGFVGNLAKAGKDGFGNFAGNFLKHFTGAVTGWLLGPVAAAGLKAPDKWDAQGIFGMVMGVMGVSKESMLGMAEERVGKENMAALTKAFEYVQGFLEGGFAGLWTQIKGDLGNLWDMVLGMVTDYITKKVVQFGVEQLASLLAGPLGALWQALKTAYNIYCTIRDKIDQIKSVLEGVFNSVSEIAQGNTGKASQAVEGALAKALGVAIDLLARVVGIGDIPIQIKGFVEGLQERVKKAIGGAMDWVMEKVSGLFKGGKDSSAESKDVQDAAKNDLPADHPIAWVGGLITLKWGTDSGIVLTAEGRYKGPVGKAIDAMIADVQKTPDTDKRKAALKQLETAKGSVAVVHSKAGKYVQGEGSKDEINQRTGDIAKAILAGLEPLDAIEAASAQDGPDQTKTHEIGQVIPFEADGHKHRVFIDVTANDAHVMVASRPKTAEQHLTDVKAKISAPTFTGDKTECEALIAKGKQLAGIADKESDAALAGAGPALAMVDEQKSLGDVMQKLFTATASPQEKKIREIIKKKLSTNDKDQLPTWIVQRDEGFSETQANNWDEAKLIAEGRRQWRGALGNDTPTFLTDVAKAIGDDIGLRKLVEFKKEHQKEAVGQFGGFFEKAWNIWKVGGPKGKNAIYDLLKAAKGRDFGGLGHVVHIKGTIFRGWSASNFWNAVTAVTKRGILGDLVRDGKLAPPAAASMDLTSTETPLFAEWSRRNANDRKIPASEYDAGVGVTYPKSGWWSPDQRYLEVIDSKIDGNEAFSQICKVGALAPEWYPDGLVQLHMNAKTDQLRRPTVFDGLMSPLWVQQDPSEMAATGGGAAEVLSQKVIKLGDCAAVYAHVTSRDVAASLKAFNEKWDAKNDALKAGGKETETQNQTNANTEDPSVLGKGRSAADKKAIEMQTQMAEQTLENRAVANGETKNLLEHLQKNEGTAHGIHPALATALEKAKAPGDGKRMPATLDDVFKARPSLKSLFYDGSGEGKSLVKALKKIEVDATLPGGVSVKRDFNGDFYTAIRKAAEFELKDSVRKTTMLESVLAKSEPDLPPKAKASIEKWLLTEEGGSLAANPDFEKTRMAFEVRLGHLAETHPMALGTGQKMAKKAWDYLTARHALRTQHEELDQEMDSMLALCGTDIKGKWSGRVGKSGKALKTIEDIFKSGAGNIRELFTQVNNFCENVLGPDVLNSSDKAVSDLITNAKLGKKAILKRRAEVDAEQNTTRDATGRNVGNQIDGGAINDGHNGDQVVKDKGKTRIKKNIDEAWSETDKAGQGETIELNNREKAMGQHRADGSVELGLLPWVEGARAWDINEENSWVQAARALNMPLAGGVSGTTNRMMQNHTLLKPGTPKSHMRLAALGYLLPMKAHSFHEVMVAARANGVGYKDGVYTPLEPLGSADLIAIGPVPDKSGSV